MSNRTIEYYNNNAKEYFEATVNADMSSICDKFLQYVQLGGEILDVGCGSGRDLKYFKEAGYSAEGIDLSPELCKMAAAYSGAKVICADIRTWRPTKKYDGIWANASLLHLSFEELKVFVVELPKVLKENGVVYLSMKEGKETGYDGSGRYISCFSEGKLLQVLSMQQMIRLVECWKTQDELQRENTIWLNIILQSSQME